MVSKPAAEATGCWNPFRWRTESRGTGTGSDAGHGVDCQPPTRTKTNIRPILFLYLLGTFSAALTAVVFSFLFPSTLHLTSAAGDVTPPSGIVEVLRGLLMSMVSNPITALMSANYIGIWSGQLGWASRCVMVMRPRKRLTMSRAP